MSTRSSKLSEPVEPVCNLNTLIRTFAILNLILLVAGSEGAVSQPIDALAKALPLVEVEKLPGTTHLGLPADARFQSSTLAFLAANVIAQQGGIL